MEQSTTIIVALSRQLGSGGSYVGQLVAKRLGLRYVDREILSEAAKILGRDEKELMNLEERASTLMEGLMKSFVVGTPEVTYIPPQHAPIYDRDLFKIEAKIIQGIAAKFSAVIVGRAAFHILEHHPGILRVFIHAPLGLRIERIMKYKNIADKNAAIAELRESDRRRGKFIHTMTGKDWTDPGNFDLCINTGRVNFKAAEEIIVTAVEDLRVRLGL
jgi:cytidylate kinase